MFFHVFLEETGQHFQDSEERRQASAHSKHFKVTGHNIAFERTIPLSSTYQREKLGRYRNTEKITLPQQ